MLLILLLITYLFVYVCEAMCARVCMWVSEDSLEVPSLYHVGLGD